MRSCQSVIFLLAGLCLAWRFDTASASEGNHKYKVGEHVRLWVNKVGPYNNPQETYNYYYLPFCKPANVGKPAHKWGGLGEVLQGNQLIDSQLKIEYRTDVQKSSICTDVLNQHQVNTFTRAVRETYWYELFIDDLPVWGFVGPPPDETPEDDNIYIYTHKSLRINYNENRIIQVNLTSLELQPLKVGAPLEFTYSVEWVPTTIQFSRRFERYLDYNFFEHQIHWFSIFNSFMMVIFLTGLVSMILLRTLRADYARYTAADEDDLEALERDMSEESGWKLVHGDVFRPPARLPLLAAMVGTGVQLSLLILGVILITIAGTLFTERGTIATVFILCYALTSVIGGYVSGGLYARNDGGAWMGTMALTASLFPLLCFSIAAVLNTIAIAYHSLAAVPFGTIVILLLIWLLLSVPLTLLGTVVGRNWAGQPDNPCRVKRIPSPIPAKKWYLQPSVIAAMGGLLPFGSIFIEMYFLLTSFWNYKVYYVYGFMLLVFVILVIVTVCVTIVGTYFLLNAENYRWQWTAFYSAGSTSLYVFMYSIHYFFAKTKMTGFFQTAFYFGYTAMFCLGLGIMCGALGYLGAAVFVRRIYRNIKCD
ncbi:hypothetical protein WJX73_007474 [Symbiochloris irregularis]|uniref:Transmembrane 9 superfamily member n=1 Tax=Symbiochloris irregularis TaxID=706552 RepID=A0AAW1PMY3_9CHLO